LDGLSSEEIRDEQGIGRTESGVPSRRPRSRFRAAVVAVCLTSAGFVAGPTHAQAWVEGKSAHVTIVSDAGADDVRILDYDIETLDWALRKIFNIAPDTVVPTPLKLYLVKTPEEYHQLVDAPGNTDGLYLANTYSTFAAAVGGAHGSPTRHEYVHHFMALHGGNYPAWFAEGFANYAAASDLYGTKVQLGLGMWGYLADLKNGPWIPFEDLLGKNPFDLPERSQSRFYEQSWLLTHWVMASLERRGQLSRYFALRNQGRPVDAAWKEAFGKTPNQLERELREYANSGFRYNTLKALTMDQVYRETPLAISPIGGGPALVIIDRQALNLPLAGARRDNLLAHTRSLIRTYPNDPEIRLVAANAEAIYGDHASGIAELVRIVEANPKNAEALFTLARLRLMVAEEQPSEEGKRKGRQDANDLLAAAMAAAPDDYAIAFAYLRNRTFESGYPSDATMNRYIHTVNMAPQVGSLRLEAAKAAILHHENDLARQLVDPVANDLHNPELATEARKLLNELLPAP
jgi:hypothetical protein